jgi:hypothetical protein
MERPPADQFHRILDPPQIFKITGLNNKSQGNRNLSDAYDG